MKCPNCKKDLQENANLCKFCGSQILEQNNTNPPEKKKSGKNIVIIALSILLVIAIVVGGIFFFKWREKEENEIKEKEAAEILTEVLKESTTKPIVEMICKDYDNNGTYEAYAVVGETDEKDAEHPEFYDADIYFVNEKKAQPIKENISGKVNGTFKLEEIIYISIEVYDEDSDEGKSFIYTADGDQSEEHKESGKYSNVHEENGEVIGIDKNGNKIEVFISGDNKETDKSEFILVKEKCYGEDGSVEYWHEYEYDSKNNMTKEIFCNDDGSIKYWDEYDYDANGNMTKEMRCYKDGSVNRWHEYEYDSKNNMTKDIMCNDDGSVDYWFEYEYEYDANSNIIEKRYIDDNSDGIVNMWSVEKYEYDVNNNLIRETYYYSSGDIYDIKEYEYDSNGNLIKEIDASIYGDLWGDSDDDLPNVYTEYEYDSQNRLIKETLYDFGEIVGCRKYEYDSNGNLIKDEWDWGYANETEYEADGYYKYEYDAYGNQIEKIYYDSIEGCEQVTEYEYALR